jgi:hypothetical protein
MAKMAALQEQATKEAGESENPADTEVATDDVKIEAASEAVKAEATSEDAQIEAENKAESNLEDTVVEPEENIEPSENNIEPTENIKN